MWGLSDFSSTSSASRRCLSCFCAPLASSSSCLQSVSSAPLAFLDQPPQDRSSMHYARLLHCLWDLSHACMSHFVRMCCCMPRVLLRCVPGMSLVLLWDFCHIPLVFLSDSSNWILDLGPSLSLDLGLRPSLHLDRPRPRPRPSTSRSPGMAPRPSPQLPGLQPPDDQLPRSPCYRS